MSGDYLLTILSPLIGSIFTICVLSLWWRHRPRAYILQLATGFVLYTLATGSQIFLIPGFSGHNTIISAVFYLACITFLIEGCLTRKNRKLNYSPIVIILAITLIGLLYYHYIEPRLSARIYIMSFGCALLFATAACSLRPTREDRIVDRIIFGVFVLLSLLLVLRPLLIVRPGDLDANVKESPFWLVFHFSLVVSTVLMGLTLLSAIVIDITSDLQRQSATDILTGVYNRRGFDERASAMIASGKFNPISLVVCDLDHFKSINDDHGHAAGDHVLRKFAALLTANARESDLVGRIGGEEFAALLTDCNPNRATAFSERVRELFETSGTEGLRGGSVTTASFGIADHRPGETLQQLMNRADRQLYAAKNSGRNCVCADGKAVNSFVPV